MRRLFAIGVLFGACALAAQTAAAATPAAGGNGAAGANGFAAYRTCLQKHGFALPARSATTPRTGARRSRPKPTAAEQKAMKACAKLRPTGGFARGFANSPAFQKFQACLKKHGVQIGQRGAGGAGGFRASPSFRTAMTACRSLLPAGAFGGRRTGGGGGQSSASFQRLQACLKQHGVNTSGGGQSPAKTQKAIAACRSVLKKG